jgi:predicted nucleic acid-binding protein
MPPSADGWCVDTSVAVAALDASHDAHEACRSVARRVRPALAGHAAFETYSVLTRLPGASRVSPEVAAEAIGAAFPARCWLSGAHHDRLLGRLAGLGIEGGMVFDAMVGEAARVARRRLLTRDVRALRVYELLEVSYQFVE